MTKKQVKSKRLIAAKNLKRGLIGLFAILAIIFIINSPILKIGSVIRAICKTSSLGK